MTPKKLRRTIWIVLIVILVLLVAYTFVGGYIMTRISMYADQTAGRSHAPIAERYDKYFKKYPELNPWALTMLRDTFVNMPSGERHHAVYARAPHKSGLVAIAIHGHRACCANMFTIGKMYSDMGYDVLMPDLHAHGLSDGTDIGMGWKERLDIMRWIKVAEETFRDSLGRTPRIVIHGVSMGAATTMNVSGETTPPSVRCFVEDCGYTSAWDEFSFVMKHDYGFPTFPLLNGADIITQLRHGWGFHENSPLRQVAQCKKPMLFIHGDADDYVPTWMVYQLFQAKPQPKKLYITRGVGHADSFDHDPTEYRRQVEGFVSAYMDNRDKAVVNE